MVSASFTFAEEKEKTPPPRVVEPGDATKPPSDAIVLFDGKDLSKWIGEKDKPAPWTVEGGVLTVKPNSGGIFTKEHFGDAQIHIEFMEPSLPDRHGQDRGNSGVYMQGRYEVQVLDSYKDETYPDGQCGALYGHHPPLVNACRPPEQWQTYDIIFHAPKVSADGTKSQPAILTVLHNGVLIQDHADVTDSTRAAPLKEPPANGPLYLQDHGSPVKYRNIWLRKLN